MTNAERVSLIFTTSTMVGTQYAIFMLLSELRYDRRKAKLVAAIFSVSILCLCIIPCLYSKSMREGGFTFVTLTLPSVLFFLIISKYRGIKFIVTYCIADISIACVDFIAYCFVLVAFDGEFYIDTVIRCVSMLIWSICLYKFIGNRYQKALEMLQKGWVLMMLVVVGMYALMSILSSYPTAIRYRLKDIPSVILTLFVMELVIIVVIRVIYNMLEIREHTEKEQELNNRIMFAEEQYSILKGNIEQVRGIKHDMKHHFLMMSQLLKDNKISELNEYIEQISEQGDIEAFVYCENYVVNVLASYFHEQAQKIHTLMENEINVPEDIKIAVADLTIVLGNIWQNAIDACEQMKRAKRYIKTNILYKEDKLIIQCENSFNGNVRIDDGTGRLLSTKDKKRGMGMENIRRLVERNGGYFHFEYGEEVFKITVVLVAKEGY